MCKRGKGLCLRRDLFLSVCYSTPLLRPPLPHFRRPVASGGWHGWWRRARARRLGRGPPSLPLALFTLPSASRLPAQERLRWRPPGLRLRLCLQGHGSGQVGPRRQGQAEEEVCKSEPTISLLLFFPAVHAARESVLSGAGHAAAVR